MTIAPTSTPRSRLRQLLVLLLLALSLLVGVSVSHTQTLVVRAEKAEAATLPVLKQVQTLARQVDEQRGLLALHLTLRGDAPRAEVEGRLLAGRVQIQRRMAAFAQQLADSTDHGHHHRVATSLAAFWQVQDRLLALSRRSPTDADAARQARALLAGDGQQTYHQLRAAIEAWWSATDHAVAHLAAHTQLAAQRLQQLLWATAGVLLLVWACVLMRASAWAAVLAPRRTLASTARPSDRAVTRADMQGHLDALNAAVSAARRGEPGRAAGLSAQEAQQLADQVHAAAQGLRRWVDAPQATPAAAEPGLASAHGDHPAR